APPQQAPPLAAGPAVVAPATTAAVVEPAAPGSGSPSAPTTPAPIVLAASAAQPSGSPVAAAASPKGPGVVLPYTGANLWLPLAAGSGLIGLGVWLRRYGQLRFTEDELPQD